METLSIPPINSTSPFASMKGNHVAIRVPDLEASKRWFVDKLDFRVIHEWPFGDLQLAYVAPATDDNFWVELLGGGTPGPQPDYSDLNESLHDAGYHHFCINVASVDDTLTELGRRGVTILGEPFDLAAIGRRLAFFADPWGNLIELAQVL
ncbi:VOC family protein [Spirosoma sp. HMF4905]|uniref:VOC family protein n=1 Tax=Spirosoma arboris TaxID=2682092 RepID=A0A7K1S941_9BACT|nr:VOC family protein [Spirosoma arboris]MVM30309.1 VOC family protein [Spirosoma arboris]